MGLSLNTILQQNYQNSRQILQTNFEFYMKYKRKNFLENLTEFWKLQPKWYWATVLIYKINPPA